MMDNNLHWNTDSVLNNIKIIYRRIVGACNILYQTAFSMELNVAERDIEVVTLKLL